jgi:hypothetical protein
LVKTEFIIKQKKQFEFKRKQADLGGDICITGNLRLGTKDKFKRYTMAMNGDAMGKSMQVCRWVSCYGRCHEFDHGKICFSK